MTTEDDDAPVYPLMGYATGIDSMAVVLALELATNTEEYEKREGSWVSTAISAAHAIELGKELIALGEQVKATLSVN